MPRTEDQSIPAPLLADYLKTFRPTAYDDTHYYLHPDARDIVAASQEFHRAGNRNPSAAQLVQRAFFHMGTEAWAQITPQEAAAYYDLSLGSGLEYYQFFMQRNILEFMGGKSIAQILRPDARRFDLGAGVHCAQALIEGASGAGGTFTWDIENEPTTAHACGYIMENYPQSFFLGKKWWNGLSWSYSYIYASDFNPAARHRWTGSYNATAQAGITWWMRFCRQGTEQVPCILWKFHLGTAQPNPVWENFIA